jgi:hypothetical protein
MAPKLSRTMDEHFNVEGSEAPRSHGIADRGTKPIDVEDVGQNRAHVGPGRDYALRETHASGSVHPMEAAGKMGKGRW